MDIREHTKFMNCHVPNGRVFCSDCGDQIILSPDCGSMICPTCNKSGYAEPELDADDSAFSITEEDGKGFYARIHPRITSDE